MRCELQSLFVALDHAPDDGCRLMVLGMLADLAEESQHPDAAALRRLYDRRWLPIRWSDEWFAPIWQEPSFVEGGDDRKLKAYAIHWPTGVMACEHHTLRGCLRHVLATLRRV